MYKPTENTNLSRYSIFNTKYKNTVSIKVFNNFKCNLNIHRYQYNKNKSIQCH